MCQSRGGVRRTALVFFVLALPVLTTAEAFTLENDGTGPGQQAGANAVNNSGQMVGSFIDNTGLSNAYVRLSPGTLTPLPPLVAGQPCTAESITDSGRIAGSCRDGAGRGQPVQWSASTPTAAPVQLFGPALTVRSGANAVNQQGAEVGVSATINDTFYPMLWPAGSAGGVALPISLLALVGLGSTNCVAVDAADGSATTPVVVGNCPDLQGRPLAVIWTWSPGLLGVGAGYSVSLLPIPSGAQFCAVSAINVLTQALGTCDYGPGNGPRTVRWAANGGAATVLTSVNGVVVHNSGIAINANGQIVAEYIGAGDFRNPVYWDPDAGTVAAIAPLPGGSTCVATDLSDTSVVVGQSETLYGHAHAFAWTLTGGTVDLGVLPGGNNSAVSSIAHGGAYAAATSEGGGNHTAEAELVAAP